MRVKYHKKKGGYNINKIILLKLISIILNNKSTTLIIKRAL